jgi:hypothetical protein
MAVRVRRFSTLIMLLAVAGVLVPAGSSRTRVLPTLYVDYTMNCTFAITDDAGKRISSIAPGTYQIQIQTPVAFGAVDLSGIHDMTACKSYVQFQISGPGVNLFTTLGDGDSAFWLYTETFLPSGTYTASDQNQPSVARLVFTTAASGSAGAQSGSTSSSTTSGSAKGTPSTDIVGSQANPFRGSLDAIVFKSGKLSLSRNGKVVGFLKSGRWTFSVDDESPKAGFAVQVLHGKSTTVTSAPYTGSHDVTLQLKPGRWFYYSPGGRKSVFFVTT